MKIPCKVILPINLNGQGQNLVKLLEILERNTRFVLLFFCVQLNVFQYKIKSSWSEDKALLKLIL
ncbi:MAG: hypothetical protein A2381_19455 [Bdellovibrionales bacterium RIFOXYB1_FULL_37_110]|nr:MAG: hypothetical protein A2417_10955 [Bdellovibrionales bacterium RIFOXYC1_FULL_37_79]OFZ60657.1 MAG: hypothetical protein A2381_19455 [Bdellovibrionales bacterium RIFOXYB1_FULL_37_110]OFZ64409.1 MAG: hypothetical protein A2577_10105 [Bdellovibrionales bacterium RIFOXYD1_FULL_36_51]